VHSVDFQNLGGLAFIFSDTVSFQKRSLDITISTFEYLYGFTKEKCGKKRKGKKMWWHFSEQR